MNYLSPKTEQLAISKMKTNTKLLKKNLNLATVIAKKQKKKKK